MKKNILNLFRTMSLFFIFIISLYYPAHLSADGKDKSLWDKSVEIARNNPDWVPGKITMKMEELKKDGTVKNTHETLLQLSPDENGEVQTRLVKATDNGKDITEESRKKMQEKEEPENKKDKKKHSVSVGYSTKDSVFSPANQKNIKVTQTSQTKEIDGRDCIAFEFQQKRETSSRKGIAWLGKNSGVPVELRFSPDPLPKRVKRMITVMRYTYKPDGTCYPAEMIVEGSGGFLFIKKYFRTVIVFSEYWKQETTQDEAG